MTSKLQVTLPKALAQKYGIAHRPDVLQLWPSVGSGLQVRPVPVDESQ